MLLVFGGFLRGLLVLLLLLLVLRGLLIGLLVLRGFLPGLFLRGSVVPQEVGRLLQYEQNEHDDDQNADHPPQMSQRPCSRFASFVTPLPPRIVLTSERGSVRESWPGESMPRGSPGSARQSS